MTIIQVIPMFGLAGAETMCENLSIELSRRGHVVYVVSLYDYHSAITYRLESHGLKVFYLGKKSGADFTIIPKLTKLVKELKPEIIHSHLYASKYATLAACLSGVKCRIHTMHNIATMETNSNGQRINYLLFHYFKLQPVSLSEEIKSTVIERYKLKDSPVVYNGIDINKCILKNSYQSSDTIKFLHIGRFSKQKNHKLLIDAFQRVHSIKQNVELHLIGGGELENSIKEYVAEKSLQTKVYFEGLQNDVYPFLNKADVFVLSSDYEGMPMTIIEAMGTGLPVVSTEVGGIGSIIDDEIDGVLTDASVGALAEGMLKCMSSKYREKIGRNARKKIEGKFTVQTMSDGYLELYSKQISC